MTYKNAELVKRFHEKKTSGSSSRMHISQDDDLIILWGYGWAVYAFWYKDYLFKCVGWYGYSSTTTSHMNYIDADFLVFESTTSSWRAKELGEYALKHRDNIHKLFERDIIEKKEYKVNGFTLKVFPWTSIEVNGRTLFFSSGEYPRLGKKIIEIILNGTEDDRERLRFIIANNLKIEHIDKGWNKLERIKRQIDILNHYVNVYEEHKGEVFEYPYGTLYVINPTYIRKFDSYIHGLYVPNTLSSSVIIPILRRVTVGRIILNPKALRSKRLMKRRLEGNEVIFSVMLNNPSLTHVLCRYVDEDYLVDRLVDIITNESHSERENAKEIARNIPDEDLKREIARRILMKKLMN